MKRKVSSKEWEQRYIDATHRYHGDIARKAAKHLSPARRYALLPKIAYLSHVSVIVQRMDGVPLRPPVQVEHRWVKTLDELVAWVKLKQWDGHDANWWLQAVDKDGRVLWQHMVHFDYDEKRFANWKRQQGRVVVADWLGGIVVGGRDVALYCSDAVSADELRQIEAIATLADELEEKIRPADHDDDATTKESP